MLLARFRRRKGRGRTVTYGLYLSATGVLTNSYRQDVIANNLANSQTVGFKRSLALFQQRRTEAQTLGQTNITDTTDPTLEQIGGGLILAPTHVDHSQGLLEKTEMNLDVAIHGRGFFAVNDGKGQQRLTRNGRFMVDGQGSLILADGSKHRVLDDRMQPIEIGPVPASAIEIESDGTLMIGGEARGRVGLFDVPDQKLLTLRGQNLLGYPDMKKLTAATAGTIQRGFVENSNVDPMTEMTQLINAHRLLEANANMIRYQDQTLAKLVNEVGKIA
jgi:flagellar basal body rod protein FlgG